MKRIIVALAVCFMLCGCTANSNPEVIITKGEDISQKQPGVTVSIGGEIDNEEQAAPIVVDKGEAVLNGDESKLLLGSGWSTIDAIKDVEFEQEIEPDPETEQEAVEIEEPVEIVEEPIEIEQSIPLKRKNFWNESSMEDIWRDRCKELIDNGDIKLCSNIAEVSKDCINKDIWLNQYSVTLCYEYMSKYKLSDDTKYSWKDEIPEDSNDLLYLLGLTDRQYSDSVYNEYLPTLNCNTNIWVVNQEEYFGDSSDYEVSFNSREGYYHEDEEHELPHLWLPKNACDIIKIGDYYYYIILYLNGTSSMDVNGYVKYTKGDEIRYMLIDLEALSRKTSEYTAINYNGSVIGYMISTDYISAVTIKQIIDGE